MLKGIKRTKNNDLVINNKGLSVLNILFITSIIVTVFFFIPLVHVNMGDWLFGNKLKTSFSMFGLIIFDTEVAEILDSSIAQLAALKGFVIIFLVYPIISIVMWVLNKKATGKKSYILVNIIYILNISFGLIYLTTANSVTMLSSNGFIKASFFVWILLIILLINIVLSIFGILRTGMSEIDENAMALDLNVDYAKDILNKAGSVATNVAENVSAAANKVTSSNTVVCDKCGNVCSESAEFCAKCGNSLKNVKKIKAEVKPNAEETSDQQTAVDETARIAREMAATGSKEKNAKDDTKSGGVSLSK